MGPRILAAVLALITELALVFIPEVDCTNVSESCAAAQGFRAVAVEAFRGAAEALGIVVAQSINILDPEAVVITGEGTDMLDLARPEFDAALADTLEDAERVRVAIRRQPSTFGLYAHGAAIGALQHVLM